MSAADAAGWGDSAAALLHALPEPCLVLDAEGVVEHANAAAAALFGVPAAALPGRPLADLLASPPEGQTALSALSALLRQGLRSAQFSPGRIWLPGTDGQAARPCRCELARLGAARRLLLRLAPATADRFIALNERIEALSREVARRCSAEAALREQGEWLKVVLRSIGDAVLATDAEGRVVFMNPVAEQLCGWPAAEAHGEPATVVFHLVDAVTREPAPHPVRAALSERRIVGLAEHTLLLARDGREHPVDDAAGPIVDDEGRLLGVVLVFREIAERLQAEQARRVLEDQLRAAQKMEAVHTLAGGIAHDFNNVVGAILGNTALALDELAPDHPVLARLSQINRAGRRARDLVRHIMAFSRRQPQVLRTEPLQPAVEECAALLRSTLPTSVRLELKLAPEPLHALADATQIQQVLLNLATNAWHALPDSSGSVTLEAARHQGLPPRGLVPGTGPWRDDAPYVRLGVSDSGCGMDEATLARIFEPFYTTKPAGRGSGLGLAVVHGIVAEHGGALAVTSTPGEGSRFDVYLPWVAAAEVEPVVPALAALRRDGGGRRIVYVDDDEIMRATVQALLRHAGFEVRVFDGVATACADLGDSPQALDLLVTDMHMADGTGLDMARFARAARADLPVILASGFVSDDLRASAHSAGVSALMGKDESFERLVPLIHELLAGGP